MKRVISLFLSVLMLLSITAGLDLSANAEPCKHTSYHYFNAKDATKTEIGYTGDKVCDDCGVTFENGTEIPVLSEGWYKNIDGDWLYYDSNINPLTGWQDLNGHTFYFDENGIMQTGVKEIDGEKYFFNTSGYLKTGWLKIDGQWYYADETGAFQIGWVKVGGVQYYLDENGVMKTGWIYYNNNWYYLRSSGEMATGWEKVKNKWYYLNSNGAMQTGWGKIKGKFFYFSKDGDMKTGWKKINGYWYFFKSSGEMATGWAKDGSKWYYLEGNGRMKTGWLKYKGCWYYLNSNGSMATDWVKVSGEWYFFGKDGIMQTGYVNVYATYTSNYVNNANRTNNLTVASKAISGTIIKPGETFNFNTVVGPRTSARGYKTATVFTGTHGTAQELGGGICQVASTMFNTCLLANVKIVERHQHSQRVSYVPLGRDAAISGSSKNFRWTNNTGYPIKIEMTVSGGKITCTFYTVEHVSPPSVSLNVSRSGNTFTLKRTVNGSVNYTTTSNY